MSHDCTPTCPFFNATYHDGTPVLHGDYYVIIAPKAKVKIDSVKIPRPEETW